ncbi:hypothetical protein LAZ67_3001062 [Cordylochernes scorpioides]|uniref:Uncharacterized protein n=1 Tax=Cordylochernes scorpioides TaxID=51811 RepID=A0ABY6K6P8_9ARAC|nr:hypothetical protein LAZ67_3001062 [Cordylochernes scorpioides]
MCFVQPPSMTRKVVIHGETDNSYTLQHGAADKSIELKQINSTLSRMEGIKPPAELSRTATRKNGKPGESRLKFLQ